MWIYPGDLADILEGLELPGPEAPELARFQFIGSPTHPGPCYRSVEFRLECIPDGSWAYVANCKLVVTAADVALAADFLPADVDDADERQEQLERLEACRQALMGLAPTLGGP